MLSYANLTSFSKIITIHCEIEKFRHCSVLKNFRNIGTLVFTYTLLIGPYMQSTIK